MLLLGAVPGVVITAAYMLRMLQRVAWGGRQNPDHAGRKDLGGREIATLAPLLVLVFWIGLQPQPFVRVMEASARHLLEQVSRSLATPPSPLP
jgi:NADH-quinone oxidoreductase subunit M